MVFLDSIGAVKPMSKKHKLFVSFSSEDNAASTKSAGWVDNFVHYLSIYIQKINHETPEIILLEGKAKRPDALGENDGLILINSKNYISQKILQADDALLSDPFRVFKIDLVPLRKNDQIGNLGLLNDFIFFNSNSVTNDFETLKPGNSDQNYWLKIIDLAFEINRNVYKKSGGLNTINRKRIYLAETSYDQIHSRDEIKRELIRHGHIVLPLTPFSGNYKELQKQVIDCLENSDLSVHIIGETYGEIPEDSDKSIVELQNQLSTEYYSKNAGTEMESLHRLIWMPQSLKARSDQQKLYLDQLRDDIASTSGAEIIQTPLEILKTVIHSRLQLFDSELKARQAKYSKRSDKKSVYLLYDKKDEGDVQKILNDISSRNFDVILPRFDSKKIEFLESHRESLVKSDGVLLFANKNLNWVNSKINDVIKAPGFGKPFPFDAKAIYLKDNSISKDKITVLGDLLVLNGEGTATSNDISPFLAKFASS